MGYLLLLPATLAWVLLLYGLFSLNVPAVVWGAVALWLTVKAQRTFS